MTATGFAFLISPLMRQLDGAVAYTLWSLLVDTWIFFFVPVLLTLLTHGRIQERRTAGSSPPTRSRSCCCR